MPDLRPDEAAVFADFHRLAQAGGHFLLPYFAQALLAQFAVFPFRMGAAFKEMESDLTDGGIDHVADLGGDQRQFFRPVRQFGNH